MAVFDKIKNIFAIDEEDLDISDLNTKENKDLLYQQELEKNKKDLNKDIVFNQVNHDDKNNFFKGDEVKIDSIKPIEVIKEQPPLTSNKQKNLDFQKAINVAYEKDINSEEIKKEEVVKKEPVIEKKTVKDSKDLVNKDTYVPRDIISPMKGIIKKHTVEIPREGDNNKNLSSDIIKMREFNKVVEVNDNNEDIPFDLFEEDTKKLGDELKELDTKPKSSLRDTSMFTLVEDSTGEMRLVIDEEE
ncbi:MAG: hypothetical protein LBR40_00360 [Bacilli bacterium]|jgi:hypothetical protein|nr:hypothetical protein [Bacilli bacterium]